MNIRWILAALMSAAVVGSGPVMAQPGAGAAQKGGARLGQGPRRDFAKELGLSPAQIGHIKAIQSAAMGKMRALQSNKSLAPDARRARFKALLADNMTKINAVLTPAQRQKMAKMMAARRAGRRN